MIIVNSFVPYLFASGIFGWGMALLLTRASVVLARRYGVLAYPNRRASHSVPTPRLGGLGIVGAFYAHMLLLDAQGYFSPAPWKTTLLVGGAWAFVGGLLDDLLHLDFRWKFLFQFAAAAAAVAVGFSVLPEPLDALLARTAPFWREFAAALFTIFFIVFFMNVFNFMDGMDGQAAIFGALAAVAFVLPAASFALPNTLGEITAAGTLAGALFGFFQFFNRPGALPKRKTFMGDCGSQFVGFALAVLALRREQTTFDVFDFWCAVIALSPFIWDVCYTLVRRLLRGENIFEAHRTHLYQRLLVAGWTHGEVLAFNFALWGLCFILAQLRGRLLRDGAAHWLASVFFVDITVLLAYTLCVLFAERRAAGKNSAASVS
ncbi:MAG: glycosyltransferase family 4 protein [Candidatus Sumerlaeaceae bacterium]|jgi:UDP-N-acetylmuramyl pentapeptide phosphotransferase/UDP-N-acetylglucosamine-1-phosphate transferase